jgi:hypothetical protein
MEPYVSRLVYFKRIFVSVRDRCGNSFVDHNGEVYIGRKACKKNSVGMQVGDYAEKERRTA